MFFPITILNCINRTPRMRLDVPPQPATVLIFLSLRRGRSHCVHEISIQQTRNAQIQTSRCVANSERETMHLFDCILVLLWMNTPYMVAICKDLHANLLKEIHLRAPTCRLNRFYRGGRQEVDDTTPVSTKDFFFLAKFGQMRSKQTMTTSIVCFQG